MHPVVSFLFISSDFQTAIPRSNTTRRPSLDGLVVLRDMVPVNPAPPPLQILSLTTNTVVHHPCVFPSVDAENRLHVHGAGREMLLVLRVSAHRAGKLVTQRSIRRLGGHVDALAPGVRRWVRRAGDVGAVDVQQAFSLQVLAKPHESGPEHGVGSSQEIEFQGFNRRAAFDNVLFEFEGDLCFGG